MDLHERALPHLQEKAATNPRLADLLDEIERGRERSRASAADDSLHAHEVTPDDAAMIRIMAGAKFGPDVRVTLPSGKTITGAEMARWVEVTEDTP